MPANSRSLALTDTYRDRLQAIRARVERTAELRWTQVDLADFEPTFTDWLGVTTSALARAQVEAVRLSAAYLAGFLALELGHRVRTPEFDATRYAGLSRDGRASAEAYDTARIGTLAALKGGADNTQALKVGLNRALRMVELDTMHAARTSLLEGIEADDRFDGWQRAVRGTCGACAARATGSSYGLHFQVHPGCQCVSEPVVRDASNRFPRPTGQEIFAAKSPQEQDEMFGPETAEKVRRGEVALADLAAQSHLDSDQPDFITQKPLAAL